VAQWGVGARGSLRAHGWWRLRSFLLAGGVALALAARADAAQSHQPSKQCVDQLVGAPRRAPAVAGTTPASVLASYAISAPPADARRRSAAGGSARRMGCQRPRKLRPSDTRLVSTTSFDSLYLVVGTVASHRLSAVASGNCPASTSRCCTPSGVARSRPGYCLIEFPPQPANGPIGGCPSSAARASRSTRTDSSRRTGYASPDEKEHLRGLESRDGVGAVTDDFPAATGSADLHGRRQRRLGASARLATPLSAITDPQPQSAMCAKRVPPTGSPGWPRPEVRP